MEAPNSRVGVHGGRRRLCGSTRWSRAVQAGLVSVLGSVSCRRVGAALSEGASLFCVCAHEGAAEYMQ